MSQLETIRETIHNANVETVLRRHADRPRRRSILILCCAACLMVHCQSAEERAQIREADDDLRRSLVGGPASHETADASEPMAAAESPESPASETAAPAPEAAHPKEAAAPEQHAEAASSPEAEDAADAPAATTPDDAVESAPTFDTRMLWVVSDFTVPEGSKYDRPSKSDWGRFGRATLQRALREQSSKALQGASEPRQTELESLAREGLRFFCDTTVVDIDVADTAEGRDGTLAFHCRVHRKQSFGRDIELLREERIECRQPLTGDTMGSEDLEKLLTRAANRIAEFAVEQAPATLSPS